MRDDVACISINKLFVDCDAIWTYVKWTGDGRWMVVERERRQRLRRIKLRIERPLLPLKSLHLHLLLEARLVGRPHHANENTREHDDSQDRTNHDEGNFAA